MKNNTRKHSGITIIEILITMVISLFLFAMLMVITNTLNRLWNNNISISKNKDTLFYCSERIQETLRSARRVDTSKSSGTKITVILPKKDLDNFNLLPLSDGDSASFYLSDITGVYGRPGTILWKAINDIPDRDWSLKAGHGKVDLGLPDLRFEYVPQQAPTMIKMNISLASTNENYASFKYRSINIYMRNSLSGF